MTITLTRKEAQQVLDALTYTVEEMRSLNGQAEPQEAAIETLRARLEQSKFAREGPVREWARISQAEPEPVMLMDAPLLLNGQPLYTTPPQRKEWQGLTDEEKHKTWYEMQNIMGWYSFQEIANAIDAKLKEKNA